MMGVSNNAPQFFVLDHSEGDITVLPYSDGDTSAADSSSEPTSPWGENENLAVSQMTMQDVQLLHDDMIHISLFGSFLVCGCLVGCTLFRGFFK